MRFGGIALGFLALGVAGLGCIRANPDFCDQNRGCDDGFYCDLDGEVGPLRNACIEQICTPEEVTGCALGDEAEIACDVTGVLLEERSCNGFACNTGARRCNECQPGADVCTDNGDGTGELVVCDDDGLIEVAKTCVLGCKTGVNACVDIDPSNGLESDLDQIDIERDELVDLVLGDGFTVNSDGIIEDAGEVAIAAVSSRAFNNGEIDVRVFRVLSLTIEGDVSFVGAGAVAFVSDGDIAISGEVTVSGGKQSGAACTAGDGREDTPTNEKAGAGGGGFGSVGGDGGNAPGLAGGMAGDAHGDADLRPLVGGCEGGGFEGSLPFMDPAGSGGGATQLVSRTAIRLTAGGAITAPGSGGGLAVFMNETNGHGGGGSGGGILLEAPTVAVADGGFVAANGGGGGCTTQGGAPGHPDATPARGGNCAVRDGGEGGALAETQGEDGQDASDTAGEDTSGSGGGAAGRIRVNTVTALSSGNRFSPVPSTGTLSTR